MGQDRDERPDQFNNGRAEKNSADLPPWLVDAPSSAEAQPAPPEPPASKPAPLAPWLEGLEVHDDAPKPGIPAEWIAGADALPDRVETDLTYDEWVAMQAELNRPRSIEEEVPDLLADLAPEQVDSEMVAGAAHELPDWFLGLEELDTSDAPDWFTGDLSDAPEPEAPAWMADLQNAAAEAELSEPDAVDAFFSSLTGGTPLPSGDTMDDLFGDFAMPPVNPSSHDDELPDLEDITGADEPEAAGKAVSEAAGTPGYDTGELDAFFGAIGSDAGTDAAQPETPPQPADDFSHFYETDAARMQDDDFFDEIDLEEPDLDELVSPPPAPAAPLPDPFELLETIDEEPEVEALAGDDADHWLNELNAIIAGRSPTLARDAPPQDDSSPAVDSFEWPAAAVEQDDEAEEEPVRSEAEWLAALEGIDPTEIASASDAEPEFDWAPNSPLADEAPLESPRLTGLLARAGMVDGEDSSDGEAVPDLFADLDTDAPEWPSALEPAERTSEENIPLAAWPAEQPPEEPSVLAPYEPNWGASLDPLAAWPAEQPPEEPPVLAPYEPNWGASLDPLDDAPAEDDPLAAWPAEQAPDAEAEADFEVDWLNDAVFEEPAEDALAGAPASSDLFAAAAAEPTSHAETDHDALDEPDFDALFATAGAASFTTPAAETLFEEHPGAGLPPVDSAGLADYPADADEEGEPSLVDLLGEPEDAPADASSWAEDAAEETGIELPSTGALLAAAELASAASEPEEEPIFDWMEGEISPSAPPAAAPDAAPESESWLGEFEFSSDEEAAQPPSASVAAAAEPAGASTLFDDLFPPQTVDDESAIAPLDVAEPTGAPPLEEDSRVEDLEGYLASLRAEMPQLEPRLSGDLYEPKNIDLDALLDAPLLDEPEGAQPFDLSERLPEGAPEWLARMHVSVDEVSAGAIVRQRADKPEAELDERLQKLRQRAEQLPDETPSGPEADPLATILTGVSAGLAPAPIQAGAPTAVGTVVLSGDQRRRADLLRQLAAAGPETQSPRRLSAIELTYDTPYLPGLEEDETSIVHAPPAAAPAAKPARRSRERRRPPFDRLAIALLVAVAVVLPFVFPPIRIGTLPPSEFAAGSPAAAAYEAVERLRPGTLALVIIEYGPAAAPELDGLTDALLRHLFMRAAYPVIIGGNPLALLRAGTLIDAINADEAFRERISAPNPLLPNQDYYLIRYLPGGTIGLRAFSEDTANLLLLDIRGQATGLDVRSLRDFPLLIVISDRADDVRAYAEQIAPLARAQTIAAVSYSAAPLVEPYLSARFAAGPPALSALLVGYADAYTYGAQVGAGVPAPRQRTRPAPVILTTPDPTPTPTPSPTPRVTPTLTPTPQPIARVIATQAINVRPAPSTANTPIGQLLPGAQVIVLGFNPSGDWVNVRLDDGREGWVSAALVQVIDNPAGAAAPKSAGYSKRAGAVPQQAGDDDLTQTPRPARTPRPTQTPNAATEDDGVGEADAEPPFVESMTGGIPEVPAFALPSHSPDYRDERWYAMTFGIIVSALIISAGAGVNIARSLLRRRRNR